MPLVRIDLPSGSTVHYRATIAETIYSALVEVVGAPEDDRFQVITEHDTTGLVIDRTYLGIQRSNAAIIVAITLREGRSVETKKAFYRAVADGLHRRVGLRPEDVFISLTETRAEDWSFGNGEAQYAPTVDVED